MEKRDLLAFDRTTLANQRTLLAFIRTGLMVLVSGITFIKLFHNDILLVIIGYILIPISIATFTVGLILFFKMKRNIKASLRNSKTDKE